MIIKLKVVRTLKVILVSKAKVRNVQRWILHEQKKTAAASIANLPTVDAAENQQITLPLMEARGS